MTTRSRKGGLISQNGWNMIMFVSNLITSQCFLPAILLLVPLLMESKNALFILMVSCKTFLCPRDSYTSKEVRHLSLDNEFLLCMHSHIAWWIRKHPVHDVKLCCLLIWCSVVKLSVSTRVQ